MKTINPDALKSIHKIQEESKINARRNAVLGKHQDPTWIQMMDHIDLAFDNFQGIKGYWNIINSVHRPVTLGRKHSTMWLSKLVIVVIS